MEKATAKKVLIISNECFSQNSSNGRTLSLLFDCFPPDCLAQFYLHGTPDRKVCSNYFCVSDQDALNAFLCRRSKKPAAEAPQAKKLQQHVGSPQTEERSGAASETPEKQLPAAEKTAGMQKKTVRSCKNLVLRDIIWRSKRWWDADFSDFLRKFQPEVVLLQAGDSPFMYAIARKIAKKYHARLMMFNTESYVLKQKLFAGAKQKSFWHLALRHRLRVQYRRFMKKAEHCIYNTQWLEDAYQSRYPHAGKSTVLYGTTEYDFEPCTSDEKRFDVTYCGNLGVGRTAPLYEFAGVLQETIPEAKLHIYGRFLRASEQRAFQSLQNTVYHGLVPYEQVRGILSASTLVFHCENSKRIENLRYAFSTKIADSLACGRPFLVYASREYPFVQYLEQNNCAHIASDRKELSQMLQRCKDRTYCDSTIENAGRLAIKNHNAHRNSEIMCRIICNEKVSEES